jgi:hypothetical protein
MIDELDAWYVKRRKATHQVIFRTPDWIMRIFGFPICAGDIRGNGVLVAFSARPAFRS